LQDDSQSVASAPADDTKKVDNQSINALKKGPIGLTANIWAVIKLISFIYLLFWGTRMLCREHKEGRKIGW
jgi:hypothetical protein